MGLRTSQTHLSHCWSFSEQKGVRAAGACFGRGMDQPTPTSGYGVEEGVTVIGAEASLLLVSAIKVRAPVLEVSEDLSWELDGQALGGLP